MRHFLHAVAANPRAYDIIQRMAGERRLFEGLEPHLSHLPRTARLLDVGGGTGGLRSIAGLARYICLDSDPLKLDGFRRRRRDGFAVLGDAANCPIASRSVDVVACARVSHHLSDAQLAAALTEIARVLRSGGTLVFTDALRSSRWSSRWLWRLDRGANPRTAAQIEATIARHFDIEQWRTLAIPVLHEFVICVARVRRSD